MYRGITLPKNADKNVFQTRNFVLQTLFTTKKLNNILVWVYGVQTPINTLTMCSEDPHVTSLDQNDFYFCTLVQENLYSVHCLVQDVEVVLTFYFFL